ncbi:penicillin-binding protein [Deinococcus roseus]|uniref:Thioredoxin n=1 Tax=Deinococcus roseus TaxID=392414 RepID=A0ABQ2CYS9_9DEIO|nr:penicillin-binding protein [Deinococcus roseus]GGJ34292.1 hypothetical protein GCM10008938_20590 [Deinococcus roseus]
MKRLFGVLGCLMLGLLGFGHATPKLGNPAPEVKLTQPLSGRYLVALYSHDCGDLTDLWKEVLSFKLPVLAVNAEGIPSPAPKETLLLQGEAATQYSRTLKVTTYPTLLLIEDGVVVGVWEPNGTSIPERLGLQTVQ